MTRKQLFWKLLAVVAVVGMLLATNAAAADEETISGTIMKTDQGIVLSADDGATFKIEGQDLSDLVGKNVAVTGTLSEGESGKTITVIDVEEISGE
ncbi:MAG: DUF5818 domain-containing protein [Desulfobacteraceae bacterium]|jgi:hypothetical protein